MYLRFNPGAQLCPVKVKITEMGWPLMGSAMAEVKICAMEFSVYLQLVYGNGAHQAGFELSKNKWGG
jgi:hypothetical protein